MMVQENTALFPHARKWRWLRGGIVIYLLIAAAGGIFIFGLAYLVFGSSDWPQPGDPPENPEDRTSGSFVFGYLKDHLPADLSDLAEGYSGGIISFYLGVLALLAVQSPAWLGLAGYRLYWSHLVGPWIADPPGRGVWFLRQMAIAYLGIVTGIIITLYGFNLYLAINNPDFVWGIWDQIFVGLWMHLLLIVYVLVVQAPGWLGLWLLHNPVNGSKETARRSETRWEYHLRRGAIRYLIVGVIGVLIWAVFQAGIDYESAHPGFFSRFSVKQDLFSLDTLWWFLLFLIIGPPFWGPILLLVQSPGWAILWWGWCQRRGVTIRQFVKGWGFNLWRKGVVGILWMSVAAAITLRSNLDHLARYDFETAYVPQDIPDFMGTVWVVVMGIQATGWLFVWQSRPGLRGNSPMRVT